MYFLITTNYLIETRGKGSVGSVSERLKLCGMEGRTNMLSGNGVWSQRMWKEKKQARTGGAWPTSVSQAYLP